MPDITLTADQQRALAVMQRGHGVAVIQGFAGSGKTTLISSFPKAKSSIILTPTGKAALRVREVTGLDARTIHRWLYVPEMDKQGNITWIRREKPEAPDSGVILVDEASMISRDVWKDLSEAAAGVDAALVLVGDGFQLPPVEREKLVPFSVFASTFPCDAKVEMTEVVRQAADSAVLRAATAIRKNAMAEAFACLPRTQDVHGSILRADAVIVHTNRLRHRINNFVRQQYGRPFDDVVPEDVLLARKNNYGIGPMGLFNGEQVVFERWLWKDTMPWAVPLRSGPLRTATFGAAEVRTSSGVERCTLALEQVRGELPDGAGDIADIAIAQQKWVAQSGAWLGEFFPLQKRLVRETVIEAGKRVKRFFEAEVLIVPHLHANFGYALTAHAGQGSEWDKVLVLLEPSVRFNEEVGRRWLYTAVTRARQHAVVGKF